MSLQASLQVVVRASSVVLRMLCQLAAVYMLGCRMTSFIIVALAVACRVWVTRW